MHSFIHLFVRSFIYSFIHKQAGSVDYSRVNDFENMTGELVVIMDGENPEGDNVSRSSNLSHVSANSDQHVIAENLPHIRHPLDALFSHQSIS